jgi:membrane-associated protease RseP (regulator of RpoE activity)
VLYAIGVFVFAIGLLLSIALHEVGHMVPAKKFGVKVTQYMVGFGPTLWSRKRGDTEYGIKALPFGGYIRMIGMIPPRAGGKTSRWPRRLATAVEDFRRTSRADIAPADQDREFYRLTPGKKMIIMVGGPAMNLLIFLILSVVLLTTIGVEHSNATTQVDSVVKCVVPANSPDAQTGNCATPNAPAYGRLQPHDKILAVDGTPVTSWDQLVSMIEPAANKTLVLTVQRDGTTITVPVTPVENLKYVNDTSTQTKRAGYLGIASVTTQYFTPLSITAVPGQIGTQLHKAVDAVGSYPAKIGNIWATLFEGKKRDPNGAIGIVGIGRVGGDLASTNLLSTKEKVVSLISLLAGVNLILFLLNLLPLLPLDGGHVAGALVEATRRGRARLRARRQGLRVRPQIFVDTAQTLPVMIGFSAVLIVLSFLILIADIVKPVNPLGG